MIHILVFFTVIFCDYNFSEYQTILNDKIINRKALDDMVLDKQVKNFIYEEMKSNLDKSLECLTSDLGDGLNFSVRNLFSSDFNLLLLTSLKIYSWNDQSQFRDVALLDSTVDNACAPIFEVFKVSYSFYTAHFQILLNSIHFIRAFNIGLQEDGRDIMKIIRKLLYFGQSKSDEEDLKIRAFSLYARALFEHCRIQYLRSNYKEFRTASSSRVNLLKTYQIEYNPEFLYENSDRKTMRSTDVSFDLKDIIINESGNITIPHHLEGIIKSHGPIILLRNENKTPIFQRTKLYFNGNVYSLLGGQTISDDEYQTSFMPRYANIIKRYVDGTVVLFEYCGIQKKIKDLRDHDNLYFNLLYFERCLE